MITYKEALELLKSEAPIFYKDERKRKITGVTWRRDPDCIYASVEVLDEDMNSVSSVSLDNVYACDEDLEGIDTSEALVKINDISEILQNIKNCFVYEDFDKAKDMYNKLMRECISLDKLIFIYDNSSLRDDVDCCDRDVDDFDNSLDEFSGDDVLYEE